MGLLEGQCSRLQSRSCRLLMERESGRQLATIYVDASLVLARFLRHVATSTFISTEEG